MRTQYLFLAIFLLGCASVKNTTVKKDQDAWSNDSVTTFVTNQKYAGPCKITEENTGRFYEGFSYDEKNRLENAWATDGGSYCKHFYDSNNRLKRVEVGLPLQRIETYIYGKNGLLLEKRDKSYKHSQITIYTFEYKFDINGRIVEQIETENFFNSGDDENPKGIFKTKVKYSYLEEGLVATERHYSLDTSDLILKVQYEYDSFGNITFARKQYSKNERNYLLKYWYNCWEK